MMASREKKSQNDDNLGRKTVELTNKGGSTPTRATPIGELLKTVTKQLIQSPTATDLMVADVRTPPRVKDNVDKLKHKDMVREELVSLGKGEAVPIVMDDVDSYELVSGSTSHTTVGPTTSSGLSTWILLSGGEQSTLASQKKTQKPILPTILTVPPNIASSKKKPSKITTESSFWSVETTEKSIKKNESLEGKPSTTKKTPINATRDQMSKVPIMLQDSKFKNRTPVIVGRVPIGGVMKNLTENMSGNKKISTTQAPATTIPNTASMPVKKKVVSTTTTVPPSTTRATYHHPETVPTTSIVIESNASSALETTDETVTTNVPNSTNSTTRRPGMKKKRKKNKNRRRRPTKKPDPNGIVESKITDDVNTNNNNSKITPGLNRPLSTRIYNYLAREVMPTVGVGLVGLMLTAGLAGLFLYPFGGGVVARKRYDKVGSKSPDGHMYYYNDYSASEVDNGQPEESVFGQVLAGMTQGESQYGTKYDNRPDSYQAPKYRHDENQDYPIHSGVIDYTGTHGKNSVYPQLDPTRPLQSVVTSGHHTTRYKSPVYTAESTDTKYSTAVRTDPISDAGTLQYSTIVNAGSLDSQYAADSPLQPSHKFSSYDTVGTLNSKYPTLTDYTSYNSPSSVSTHHHKDTEYTDTDNTNHTSLTLHEEDKSDKSQPQFSALKSSSQYSSTSNAGYQHGMEMLIPITGAGYSTEGRHHQGVLAIEHGPRSLKNRNKRSVEENEIDASIAHDDETVDISTITTYKSTDLISMTGTETISTDSNELTTTDATNTVKSHESQEELGTHPTPESSTQPNGGLQAELTTSPNTTTITNPAVEDSSFMGFLRRLAQMKIRLGINLLRSASGALTKYLETVQQRMETAMRNLEKSDRREKRTREGRNGRRIRRQMDRKLKKETFKKGKNHLYRI